VIAVAFVVDGDCLLIRGEGEAAIFAGFLDSMSFWFPIRDLLAESRAVEAGNQDEFEHGYNAHSVTLTRDRVLLEATYGDDRAESTLADFIELLERLIVFAPGDDDAQRVWNPGLS